MKIKKRWIIWVIIIEVVIAISMWATIKDETYDGDYYKYYTTSEQMTEEYDKWMNEKNM